MLGSDTIIKKKSHKSGVAGTISGTHIKPPLKKFPVLQIKIISKKRKQKIFRYIIKN